MGELVGGFLAIGLFGIPVRKWVWRSFWGSPLIVAAVAMVVWVVGGGDPGDGAVMYGAAAVLWMPIYWFRDREHRKGGSALASPAGASEMHSPPQEGPAQPAVANVVQGAGRDVAPANEPQPSSAAGALAHAIAALPSERRAEIERMVKESTQQSELERLKREAEEARARYEAALGEEPKPVSSWKAVKEILVGPDPDEQQRK